MFQTESVEKMKTHVLYSIIFFFENREVYEVMWNNTVKPGRPQVAHEFYAGYLMLQTHTQNMYCILLFQCNNSCTNLRQFYFIRILPVLFLRICVKGQKTYLVKTAKSFFGHPSFSSLLHLSITLPLLSNLPSNKLYRSYFPCKLRVPPMALYPNVC
jgi:hypothetical protein